MALSLEKNASDSLGSSHDDPTADYAFYVVSGIIDQLKKFWRLCIQDCGQRAVTVTAIDYYDPFTVLHAKRFGIPGKKGIS